MQTRPAIVSFLFFNLDLSPSCSEKAFISLNKLSIKVTPSREPKSPTKLYAPCLEQETQDAVTIPRSRRRVKVDPTPQTTTSLNTWVTCHTPEFFQEELCFFLTSRAQMFTNMFRILASSCFSDPMDMTSLIRGTIVF